ncbi:hypothetical protein [Pseudonocardia sp. WMMC193]|uniref:hypothetical protein n=1 Tax=Pseudonocardia sp. WMMC193 TaxID=2911965 RepID=UPI001F270FF5|nr:hypothetical protein [Pseudonocardia sp. WMMC193]MCF7553323.1 hypothetical protein [Pseudonocardia sp. WMMC193]
MARYEGTSTPFESMSLKDIREPVVAGAGAGSIRVAADALEDVGRRLDALNGEMASIERAYAEAHQGDTAERTRSFLRVLGEPGRLGALTFPSAVRALREQAEHYELARTGMEAVEPAATPSTARTAAELGRRHRDQAASVARRYENASNQNLVQAFEPFTPVGIQPPNGEPVDLGPAPQFPQAGSVGAGSVPLAPAQVTGVPVTPVDSGARAPEVAPSQAGAVGGAQPGASGGGSGGSSGGPRVDGLGSTGLGTAPSGAQAGRGPGAPGAAGPGGRAGSASGPGPIGSTGLGRGPSGAGATGWTGRGRPGTGGEPGGRGAGTVGGRGTNGVGVGRAGGGVAEGAGRGIPGRGVLEPAPRGAVGERAGVLGAEEARPTPRSTSSSHLPLVPGAGAGARPGESRGRPGWLVEEDPEGAWAADVPDHCPPVLGRRDV